jgi:1,2-diacylglycerol 3-alpha-glucosyltransferase
VVTGQFSDSFPPIMDGVALTVRNYVSQLNGSLGPTYAVVPAAARCGPKEDENVYRYFSLPLAGRHPYRVGLPQVDRSLTAALHALPFDLVHAHTPFSAGRLALRVARRRGIPIVATFHSKYRDNLQQLTRFGPVVNLAVRWMEHFYDAVDEVWVPTRAALTTLREYGYRGPAEIVRNAVDLEPPRDPEAMRREGARFLGAKPKEIVLLYVGQHAWEKNTELLIRALGVLSASGGRFRMAFVGEGYAAGAMKELASRLHLSGCTSFHGVVRDRAVLSACYARADCLVFPSLYETNGLVVSEAAAFGVPSLLARGSAATEGTADGVNAFVAEGSVSAFAARLHELITHRGRLAEVGRAAYRSLYRPWSVAMAEVRDRYVRLVRRGDLCGEPKTT